ncbi:MAG: hypothetical protein IJW08_10295, partial [Lentisphaeria bacterium]|nr:hypothetical protein [Lentisphaeria bacterium]
KKDGKIAQELYLSGGRNGFQVLQRFFRLKKRKSGTPAQTDNFGGMELPRSYGGTPLLNQIKKSGTPAQTDNFGGMVLPRSYGGIPLLYQIKKSGTPAQADNFGGMVLPRSYGGTPLLYQIKKERHSGADG